MASMVRRRAAVSARAVMFAGGAAGATCAAACVPATPSATTHSTMCRTLTARSRVVELAGLLRADKCAFALLGVDDRQQLDRLASPAIEGLAGALHDPDFVPILELQHEFRILAVDVLLAELLRGSWHAAKVRGARNARNGPHRRVRAQRPRAPAAASNALRDRRAHALERAPGVGAQDVVNFSDGPLKLLV